MECFERFKARPKLEDILPDETVKDEAFPSKRFCSSTSKDAPKPVFQKRDDEDDIILLSESPIPSTSGTQKPFRRLEKYEEDVICLSDDEKILPPPPKKTAPTETDADKSKASTIDLTDLDWDEMYEDMEEFTEFIRDTPSTSRAQNSSTAQIVDPLKATPSTSGEQILNKALQAETSFVEMDLNQSVTEDGYTLPLNQYRPFFPANSSTPSTSTGQYGRPSLGKGSQFFGLFQNDGNEAKLKSRNLEHSKKMLEVFKKVFNLTEFRQNQLEAINSALLGFDVFVIMPTGGGKSLCYQLPAMVSPGVTIVVSPLRSLILDQETKMNERSKGCAVSLTGDIGLQDSRDIFASLRSYAPTIKIVFVTPEKISASGSLMSLLKDLYNRNLLARFVIDEAHCVSQWGHDFRPDYKKLSNLRTQFPKVPYIALTATATQKVRLDIANQLGLKNAKWFMQSFNRPNLKLEVRSKNKQTYEDIVLMLAQQYENKSGIIYCLSRNDCDTLADKLVGDGFKVVAYHAGLNDFARKKVQNDWINGKYHVVVATIAFGMGIDKADVRFVIHNSMPKSIEGYYQEVGRAGRDGELSTCILYYTPQDFNRWKTLMTKSTFNKEMLKTSMNYLYDVQQFCANKAECRRTQILKYFGENFDRHNCIMDPDSACDNCLTRDDYKEENFTDIVKIILSSLGQLVGPFSPTRKENISPTQLTSILCGSKDQHVRDHHRKAGFYAICSHLIRNDVTRLVQELIAKKFLAEDTLMNKKNIFASFVYVRLGERAADITLRNEVFKFSVSVSKKKSSAKKPKF